MLNLDIRSTCKHTQNVRRLQSIMCMYMSSWVRWVPVKLKIAIMSIIVRLFYNFLVYLDSFLSYFHGSGRVKYTKQAMDRVWSDKVVFGSRGRKQFLDQIWYDDSQLRVEFKYQHGLSRLSSQSGASARTYITDWDGQAKMQFVAKSLVVTHHYVDMKSVIVESQLLQLF